MNLFRLFFVLIVIVGLFTGLVGCEGGCSDSTSGDEAAYGIQIETTV